ncbi:Shedu immune nuclease family protein [Myxococcus vastator]|uniref:Shedu immune nuclease family protein n=1 Tax=Myxococcus vastator TaxID=2709664 RepID=UPI0013D324A6|nr:Shedu immune nuclease family protein [Myxococcus vastator]
MARDDSESWGQANTGKVIMRAKIKQTGPDSATVEPITLRPGKTTRLVFKSQLVNNKQDEKKPVRGELVWQKRKSSEQTEEWVDETQVKLTSMTAGSGIKLELSTDEIYQLTHVVRGLYGVYWRNGKRLPSTGDEFELSDYVQAAKVLDTLDATARVIETMNPEGLVSLFKWIAGHDNAMKVVEALPKLAPADLAGLNALAGLGMLKQALSIWNTNRSNADENFWQSTLTQYSFVFSQVFSMPVVIFGTKTYVGGKSLEDTGGKQPDFLLQSELTSHVMVVEIKTPETPLLSKSPYRPPDVFAVSRDVCGAVGQIGRYKDTFLENYAQLHLKSKERFLLADPKCLVVVGNTEQLETADMKDSFEYFRRGQRGTEIITFDELFKKIETLIRLLESGAV